MRTIELDDDVYRYLLLNAEEIGESASSILRRLLGLSSGASSTSAVMTAEPSRSTEPADDRIETNPDVIALREFVASGEMLTSRSVVDRFLLMLGFLHNRHPADFHKLLSIRGRERVYFGQSFDEVNASGNSVFPQQIPGSKYWVMTNSPTRQKLEILLSAFSLFGYPLGAAREAAKSITR